MQYEDPPDEDEDDDFADEDNPDYDLSEARGYGWEPERSGWWPLPRWFMVLVTVLVIVALVVPTLIIVLQYG